ncbi:MAG TPA: TAXI family TRAP transporter solute-binding subunit [Xanthobacteraceae bacterium]|nr:TAXI family TRAP transporter solute-binding subunit [Xanthobacteraceae bacterium]
MTAAMSLEALGHTVRNRIRAFLRHTRTVTILGMIILGGLIWAALHVTLAPTEMRVAAGPPGSADVKFVEMLSHKFAVEHDRVQLHLVATDGPKASAAAVANGEADLAVLPSTLGDSPDWPVVAILRQNVMALIAPTQPPPAPPKKEAALPPAPKEASAPESKEKAAKPEKGTDKTKGATADKGKGARNEKNDRSDQADKTARVAVKSADKAAGKNADKATDKDADNSGDADNKADKADADANKLDSVSKLAGHRIGVVTGNAATREVLDVVLSHYGVPLNQVQVSLIDPSHIAEAVKALQVDVLFVAGAETGQAINDVVAAATVNGQAPSFIPIDQAEGMAKRNNAFQSVDIEAGTFGGNPTAPPDGLKSLSFPEYLVAKKSFHHDAIGTLAKLIFTSRLALAAAMPGEIKIRAPATEKDANVVVHPGALAYLNDDQKSFFDKYGDDIFYGLLIFPIFGSAIAGVASYFRSSGRPRRLRLLQRLLDLTQKANHAPSLEALDKLQVDVDHLVVAIIHQTEQEEYDEAVQASFGLALDQVRFAIAGRRAVLLEHGGSEAKPGAKAAAA